MGVIPSFSLCSLVEQEGHLAAPHPLQACSFLLKREWPNCPSLRALREHILIVRPQRARRMVRPLPPSPLFAKNWKRCVNRRRTRASFTSKLLKKSASGVLAALRGSTYRAEYESPLRLLRSCLRNGASWRAGVGRVRSLAFLNSLLTVRKPSTTACALCFPHP